MKSCFFFERKKIASKVDFVGEIENLPKLKPFSLRHMKHIQRLDQLLRLLWIICFEFHLKLCFAGIVAIFCYSYDRKNRGPACFN